MAEFLYATSHLAGTFTNPNNANGNTPATWAGPALNTNTSETSRWAIGDPVDPLTGAATQTIRVVARKGTNSGNPTIALNLYENGSLVQSILAATNVTSTSGQTLVGTFNTSVITNRNNVEIEVVMTGAGGSPTVRNAAQISHIEWEADTSAASNPVDIDPPLGLVIAFSTAHIDTIDVTVQPRIGINLVLGLKAEIDITAGPTMISPSLGLGIVVGLSVEASAIAEVDITPTLGLMVSLGLTPQISTSATVEVDPPLGLSLSLGLESEVSTEAVVSVSPSLGAVTVLGLRAEVTAESVVSVSPRLGLVIALGLETEVVAGLVSDMEPSLGLSLLFSTAHIDTVEVSAQPRIGITLVLGLSVEVATGVTPVEITPAMGLTLAFGLASATENIIIVAPFGGVTLIIGLRPDVSTVESVAEVTPELGLILLVGGRPSVVGGLEVTPQLGLIVDLGLGVSIVVFTEPPEEPPEVIVTPSGSDIPAWMRRSHIRRARGWRRPPSHR
jgi:hypothetical protein